MNKNIIIGIIAGILVIGGGSFYAGIKFAGASNVPMGQEGQFRGGQNKPVDGMQDRQGLMGGGITSGQIISKDDTSITVKLTTGGSKIIFLTPSTIITKNTTGSVGDLVLNESVVVNGSLNSDGSINAQSIQLGAGDRFGSPMDNRSPQN